MADPNSSSGAMHIDSLVAPVSLEHALETRRGYVRTHEAEHARPAAPAVFVNGAEHHAHLQGVHLDVQRIRDLGLYFLPEGIIAGYGFPFVDDRFVIDDSEPTEIALKYAGAGGYLEPGSIRHRKRIELSKPALLIAGPGHNIWGHWLLDFLPRLALFRRVLGNFLDDFIIPVSADTPHWVYKAARFLCQIGEEKFLQYDMATEAIGCGYGIIMPTYAHSHYFLHSFLREFYLPFVRNDEPDAGGRIFVSRRRFARQSKGPPRMFKQQEYFEHAAGKWGFNVVHPEELDFQAQIDLFAGAAAVVGEFGSGMHNALFSPTGTVVGQFLMGSPTQSRIAGLCGHRSVYLLPDIHPPSFAGPEPWLLEASTAAIETFFEAVDRELARPAAMRTRSAVGDVSRSDARQ
jgi:hypothetical protein